MSLILKPEENKVLNILIAKFPDFGNIWKKHEKKSTIEYGYLADDGDFVDEITYTDDEITLYEVARVFSEYVIHLYEKNDTNTLKSAFSEIEKIANNSNKFIADVGLVGFVEDILILRSHKNIPVNAFDEWLEEGSKRFWYQMHDFFTNGPKRKRVNKGTGK